MRLTFHEQSITTKKTVMNVWNNVDNKNGSGVFVFLFSDSKNIYEMTFN